MKYLNSILAICIILSGCTATPDPCLVEHTYTERQVDDWGVTLKPSKGMYVSFEQVSQYYQDTMQCLGMTAMPGPKVVFKKLGGGWAYYNGTNDTVYINTEMNEVFYRNCQTDKEALRHEFIHHILSMNGLVYESVNHHPDYFHCQYGVNQHN